MYEESGGDGAYALIALFIWCSSVFILAKSFHIWKYINGNSDSHQKISDNAFRIMLAAMIGAMYGVPLAIFGAIFVIAVLNITGIDLAFPNWGFFIIYFASAQVCSLRFLLNGEVID